MLTTTIKRCEIIADAKTRLVAETCPACGCWHAMPEELYKRARCESDFEIYCPVGHRWHYTEGLRGKLDKAKTDLRLAQARSTHYYDQYKASERSNKALKGVVTRTKNRIGKGVCPCCNRYFKQLAEHIKTKHPHYVD